MNCSQPGLEDSYAFCRRVARQAQSSFYPSFSLLQGAKRRAMEALYAFLRHTDDLGDCPRSAQDRRQSLIQWRSLLSAALRQSDSCPQGGSPLLPALVDTVRRFRIPEEHLFAVIEGVEMDVAGRRYRTFAELTEYCHRVAAAVGLACIHVWGFRGPEALDLARSCGVAFQLTNILRDLKEDAARGRVYLPQEDLDQCEYSIEDLVHGVADERFDRLMAIEIKRARALYGRGVELFDCLEPSGRRIFGMMLATYQHLLEALARQPRSVLLGRRHLGRWEKLRIAARWTFLPPRKPRFGPVDESSNL